MLPLYCRIDSYFSSIFLSYVSKSTLPCCGLWRLPALWRSSVSLGGPLSCPVPGLPRGPAFIIRGLSFTLISQAVSSELSVSAAFPRPPDFTLLGVCSFSDYFIDFSSSWLNAFRVTHSVFLARALHVLSFPLPVNSVGVAVLLHVLASVGFFQNQTLS